MTARESRKDPLLILALASGASVASAARQAGVSEATAYRRLRDESFRKAIADAQADMLARTVAKLTGAGTQAVETLKGLLRSRMDFARLAAARSILELGTKLREHEDLAGRVAALEERLSKGDEQWKPRAV